MGKYLKLFLPEFVPRFRFRGQLSHLVGSTQFALKPIEVLPKIRLRFQSSRQRHACNDPIRGPATYPTLATALLCPSLSHSLVGRTAGRLGLPPRLNSDGMPNLRAASENIPEKKKQNNLVKAKFTPTQSGN